MKNSYLIYIFFILLFSTNLYAQDGTREQLAIQYYQNEEYDKAIDIFEELFKENKTSEYYYNYYFDCLIKLDKLDDAENELKKLYKKYDKVQYAVDLGYVYALLGEDNKQSKLYKQIISDLPEDEDKIQLTANAFIKREEYDNALETYLKGRKILKDNDLFVFTVANLFYKKGEDEKMLQEYIKALYLNESSLESIEDILQDYVLKEDNYEQIKTTLIKEVQSSNYNPIIVDFLSWVYIQKKDFKAAFKQQIALDKRFKNNNQGLIKLADVCISNLEYEVPLEIYEYITDKGSTTPYYYHAKFGLIDLKYINLKSKANPTNEEIKQLEKDYTQFLSNDFYKYINLSEKVIVRLAEIKAVYLNDVNSAINLLNKYIKNSQISKTSQAQMKLSLGDYYVLSGNVWDAILLYKQVYNDFKDNPIGQEAKFRDAKLAFYRGQFDYAKDYLNVLKASTTDMISNDAIQLSLLIQDNTGLDTSEVPLRMFARADFFVFKNNLDSAEFVLDSILNTYTYHSIHDEVYMLKAKIEFKRKNYSSAIEDYEFIIKNYSDDILADDAIYAIANIYLNNLSDSTKAVSYYEKIILDHPESVFVVDARKKYRELTKYLKSEDLFFREP